MTELPDRGGVYHISEVLASPQKGCGRAISLRALLLIKCNTIRMGLSADVEAREYPGAALNPDQGDIPARVENNTGCGDGKALHVHPRLEGVDTERSQLSSPTDLTSQVEHARI